MGWGRAAAAWDRVESVRLCLLIAACVAAVLLLPGVAGAQSSSDPQASSPSGAIYEIPLEAGRRDAAPRGSSPSGGGSPRSTYRSENNFGSSSGVPGASSAGGSDVSGKSRSDTSGESRSRRQLAGPVPPPTQPPTAGADSAGSAGPSGGGSACCSPCCWRWASPPRCLPSGPGAAPPSGPSTGSCASRTRSGRAERKWPGSVRHQMQERLSGDRRDELASRRPKGDEGSPHEDRQVGS